MLGRCWSYPPRGLLNKILRWLSTTQWFIDPHPFGRGLFPQVGMWRLKRKGIRNYYTRARHRNTHTYTTPSVCTVCEGWMTHLSSRKRADQTGQQLGCSCMSVLGLVGISKGKSNVACSPEPSNGCWIHAVNMVRSFNGSAADGATCDSQ